MKKNMDPSGNSFFRSDAGGIFDLIFYVCIYYKVVSAKKKGVRVKSKNGQ